MSEAMFNFLLGLVCGIILVFAIQLVLRKLKVGKRSIKGERYIETRIDDKEDQRLSQKRKGNYKGRTPGSRNKEKPLPSEKITDFVDTSHKPEATKEAGSSSEQKPKTKPQRQPQTRAGGEGQQ